MYATVFPEKIIKSAQVHEDNIKLQRDIKNLKDDKGEMLHCNHALSCKS